MAKGLRSSVKKTNRSKLKKGVFGPVESARTERLSARLLELAQQPKPERNEMEVETEAKPKDDTTEAHVKATGDAMDVDGAANSASAPSKSKKKAGRIEKKRHRKPRNEIAFRQRSRPGEKLAKSKRRRL